jgi:DNA polymerase-3 subunit delta
MKATQKTFAGMVERALPKLRVCYFCGADEAGAGDAAALVATRLCAHGRGGATETVELTGSELKRDPARLADEARSSSLFGDSRVIRVTMSGDEAHDAIAALIADPVSGWPVLIVATGATDKSRVAKLLADRDDALVAMFYPPDVRAVADGVRSSGEALGVRMNDQLAQTIAQAASLDTRIARSELEKLALYLDASRESPRTATPDDFAAIGTEAADDNMAPIVNAALGGATDRLGHEMGRVAAGEINAVGLLLAVERRAVQLAQLAARLGPGGNVRAFIEQEAQAKRIFFREKGDLMLQLHKWRGARLERLLSRLADLHRAMLTDNVGAQLRLQQALAEIARVAAR